MRSDHTLRAPPTSEAMHCDGWSRTGARSIGPTSASQSRSAQVICPQRRVRPLPYLFCRQALTVDGESLLTEHRSDTSVGDAIATADLPGGLTGLVPSHCVRCALGAQNAFVTRFSDLLYGRIWPCR